MARPGDNSWSAGLILSVNSRHPAISHFRCSILQRLQHCRMLHSTNCFQENKDLEWVMQSGKESNQLNFLRQLSANPSSWWSRSHEYDDHDSPGAGTGPWCDQSHHQSHHTDLDTRHRHQLSAIWLRYPAIGLLIMSWAISQSEVRVVIISQSEACISEDVMTRWNTWVRWGEIHAGRVMIGILGQHWSAPDKGRTRYKW